MRKRTKARECALQVLYQIDIAKIGFVDCLRDYWNVNNDVDRTIKDFTNTLVKGVSENMADIDKVISTYATNWNIDRMAVVDRNILRLASYELMFVKEIPPKVSINEAVDIAKKYGDKESGKFVNGILDRISKEESIDGKKS